MRDSATGVVFDIQRFSVHDGPGIRTTVFLKGCPLRCQWCHNPEGLSPEIQLQFRKEDCIGCGSCGGTHDLASAALCPARALTPCGREMTVEEVLAEIRKDLLFYGESGGVTCSGGECLLQADFVAELLGEVRGMGLHTAVDTAGAVAWQEIAKTLDVCELYLYDVKCIDAAVHKQFIGIGNSLILENLQRLSRTGKDIWIRVPVIPGFNDSEAEMTSIADFVAGLSGIRRVTLMPYHSLGSSKYESLGLEYRFDPTLKISDTALSGFRKLFESRGLRVD